MLDELSVLSRALSAEPWDWKTRIGSAVVLVIGILLSTRLITTLTSTIALWQKGDRKTPTIAPYSIPGAGNLFQFAFDTHAFLSGLLRTFGSHVPVRFRVANQKLYLISGAEMVQALFRASKELTTVPSTIRVLETTFGFPSSQIPIFTRDQTGIYLQPRPGAPHMEPNNRIFHLIHSSVHTHLSGSGLAELAPKFMDYLAAELNALDIAEDWIEIPDLYSVIQTIAFKASMNAVCGPHFLRLNPTFSEDFWQFDSRVMDMFKSIPRWLIPGPYAIRDKLKDQIAKWHAYAQAHQDPGAEEISKLDWEEFYGSRLMRERQKFSLRVDGMTAESISANDLGMIWGANANIIPMIGWEVMDTFKRPELLAKCRAEIEQIRDPSSTTPLNIPMSKLLNLPLLQSIYSEELRLRNGVIIQRVPMVDNFEMTGYKFPKDRMIVASSWHEQRDRNVWNEGPVNGEFHSVEDFWAERFLVYPDDPTSGPRKPGTGTGTKRTVTKNTPSGDKNEPKFTTEPVAGSFIPYGGGAKVCPGRFYAKQEALSGLALFIMMFDVEFLGNKELKPNMNFFPFGVVPPLGKYPAMIRRRQRA